MPLQSLGRDRSPEIRNLEDEAAASHVSPPGLAKTSLLDITMGIISGHISTWLDCYAASRLANQPRLPGLPTLHPQRHNVHPSLRRARSASRSSSHRSSRPREEKKGPNNTQVHIKLARVPQGPHPHARTPRPNYPGQGHQGGSQESKNMWMGSSSISSKCSWPDAHLDVNLVGTKRQGQCRHTRLQSLRRNRKHPEGNCRVPTGLGGPADRKCRRDWLRWNNL